MCDDMSPNSTPLTIIVAACLKNGIGKDGALPWPMLKKEMAYFARVTKRVPHQSNTTTAAPRNVVIMGRKTWDSIPPKFRPLKDRTNIVISTKSRAEIGPLPEDVVVTTDIASGLTTLQALVQERNLPPIGRAFIIGGSSIYEQALRLPQTTAILLTRINKDYDCDTVFPVELPGQDKAQSDGTWQRSSLQTLRDFTGEDIPDGSISEQASDGPVEFEYQLYERR
ncbi:dihydrofolate reductase-like domain-containing protein [Neohortaea acidophila]|uniref:Dihydrofolate reductase n=1 Tax=Neohortaea acidophila TaxID=245834 RepID=A0A6A6Q1E3_9PEZI|nr:dihydrofolate reductase-like domain-containing protein [Neohortaea acidophila]KAF2485841.1 dihydrofolate reductase-like domain-containing protein [Neohortaea acidophila]